VEVTSSGLPVTAGENKARIRHKNLFTVSVTFGILKEDRTHLINHMRNTITEDIVR
jgi:hypothetical protein